MGAAISAAMSAIDVALWDILGKSVNLPVYQLLGGKCRDKVKVFNNVGGDTLAERAESANPKRRGGVHLAQKQPHFSRIGRRAPQPKRSQRRWRLSEPSVRRSETVLI